MLLVGQLVLVVSRAAFWPATWAMASELPGARGVQLGRLNAVTNFGQIVGTTLCGFLLAAAGFQPTFAVLAATGAIALAAGLGTQAPPPKPAPPRHVLAAYLPLLRERIIAYTVMCAYLSALPFSLRCPSTRCCWRSYGLRRGSLGHPACACARSARSAPACWSRASCAPGRRPSGRSCCGIAVAAAVGFVPTVNHVVPIGFWMLVVGAGTAAMTLYFQITISEASKPEERGSALALGGLGWSVSHLTTPLIMGFLADRYGIVTGFYVLACFALVCALAIAYLRHWAFRRP